MYQNEYLYLEVISYPKEDDNMVLSESSIELSKKTVENLFISLYGYLSFLEKIYLKVFLYTNLHDNLYFIPSSFHRVFKKYSDEEESNELDIKKIELKSNLTPIQLYEEICKVPYSIRLYEKNLKNRDVNKEEEYYQKHIERYQCLPYLFCTSYYGEDNEKSLPIYIIKNPYFHDNIYDTYWYESGDRSKYHTLKIIENAEEIHLQSDEKEWMELMYFLDLTKVKRRVIYYQDEEEIVRIQSFYPWLTFFHFIKIN